ncbi:MAG: hypothetical protein ACYSQZ_04760 [Planctomycetota bacterium]|jgi:hypothetical protein
MQNQMSALPNEIQRIYQNLLDKGLTLRWDGTNILVSPPSKIDQSVRGVIAKYRPGIIAILQGYSVNDWKESLEKGDNSLVVPFLEAIYRRAFYNYVGCVFNRSGDSVSQNRGCDVIVYLTNDRTERIDHKIRYDVYPDIALEYISSDRSNTPGWIEKDLSIDYLNYVKYPARQAFLFPWHALKKVWIKNGEEWLKLAKSREDGFFIARAPNATYQTLSCCIPDKILVESVKGAAIITLPHNWNSL